jgi:MYXO-CTERM domain-containing protein
MKTAHSSMLGLVFAASVAAVIVHAHDARACGGCFHGPPPPNEVESVITDHRMVFSLSPTQSVLWDQVRYSGNPIEFAWVLPVHPGTLLELSRDPWIAALDASTQTIIAGPSITCGPPGSSPGSFETEGVNSGGGGCGGGAASLAAPSPAPSGSSGPGYMGSTQVQIVSQEVVGPYVSVTLQSTNPMALNDWLTQNGFVIPVAIQPTIDAYIGHGFDFIALKLRPGQGVRAMQPVRVVSQGADPTLPLRMVAAGAGVSVGLTLYVISEGRYHPQDFPDVDIDFTQLTWDPHQNDSNYETLALAAMKGGNGTGWLTEFAGQPLLTPTGRTGGFAPNGMPINPGLADAYLGQCVNYAPLPPCDAGAPPLDDAGDAAMADAAADDSSAGEGGASEAGSAGDAASDGGTAEATADTGSDAAAPATACPKNPSNSCEYFDDLNVALTGLHMSDVWVTRLRAFFPATALNADLVLEASPSQIPATNVHVTSTFSDPSFKPCGSSSANQPTSTGPSPAADGGCSCRVAPSVRVRLGQYFLLSLTALGLATMLRRRRL